MKFWLKISLAAVLVLTLSGQTVSTGDKMHARLREIGEKLKCQCGTGCAYTVGSCNMLNCHFRTEVYDQMREDIKAGVDETTILGKLKDKYGTIVLAAPPAEGFNVIGWAMPFVTLVLGLVAIRYVLIRWRRPRRPLAPAGSAVVEKFHDQIEKELADQE